MILALSTGALLSILSSAQAGETVEGRGSLHLRIVERGGNGQLVAVPARVHLADARGQPILAPGSPSFKDHFNCDGDVRLDLSAGPYTYTVERARIPVDFRPS